MELTIEKALQKAVEAHKAGKVQEADRLYTAILKAQPNHPDANHNLGILAVGVGKANEALPFLKTALDANPSVAQFWLSYIDALIKLDRIADAKAVLNEAKSKGAHGDVFDKLKQRLQGHDHDSNENNVYKVQNPPQDHVQSLIDLFNKGQLTQAVNEVEKLVEQFPRSALLFNILGAVHKGLGQLDASVEAFAKAVAIKPDYAEAYNNMGNALKAQTKLEEAIKVYKTALAIKPDYAEAYNNMGNALKAQTKLEEAIKIYKKALAQKSDFAEAYNNLGNALKEQRRLDEALEAYNEALAIKPNFVEAHNNMGNAFKDQFKLDEAIASFNKALIIKPDYAEAYNNLGNALKEQAKLDEAIEAYNKALAIKPNFAEAYNNLGNALKEQGKPDEAIDAFNKALSIKSDFAEAYNNIGNALQEQGKLDEAIDNFNKGLSINSDFAEAYNNLGVTLQEQGKLDEAIEAFKKAIAIKPDYAEAQNNMGSAFQERGALEESINAFKKALEIKPNFAGVHRNLSTVTKYNSETAQISDVQAMLKRIDISDSDRCHLLYTYAKMQEDLGNFRSAFNSYVAGGDLRRKLLEYKHTQDERLFGRIKQKALKLKDVALNASIEPLMHTPVFILGMPRSGTTLVEQIISSHSKVTGAGELVYASIFGERIAADPKSPTSADLLEFRYRYLAELAKRANGQAYVTDKMPQNFKYIALICASLPEAKIIHVKRNSKATCWSNFKHYFTSNGLGYSYNLVDTVKYYQLYTDLMLFWYQNYEDSIYNLDYEKLTENQDLETKRLIEYLGLDWEDSCLAPQKNKRSVRTASHKQVRQKIYTGSSQAWRKYEPFLNGVFDELEADPHSRPDNHTPCK